MDALLIMVVVAAAPILAGVFFRVNAVFLFLSIAVGFLLVQYVGDDAGLVLDMLAKNNNNVLYGQLSLLYLPSILTILFLKKTMPKAATLLHIPLLIGCGLALATLTLPLLDSHAQEAVYVNPYGAMLRDSQDLVIVVVAVLALVAMWLTFRHKESKRRKKHH